MEEEQSGLITSGELIHQGEPITISLEDAAQLILQQQGISGDGEVHLPPGTYQIHTQTTGSSGVDTDTAILNPINVAQTIEQGMLVFDAQSSGMLFQTENEGVEGDQGNELLHADETPVGVESKLLVQQQAGEITHGEREATPGSDAGKVALEHDETMLLEQEQDESISAANRDFDSQSESVLQIDIPVSQSDEGLLLECEPVPGERTQSDDMASSGITIFSSSGIQGITAVSSIVTGSLSTNSSLVDVNGISKPSTDEGLVLQNGATESTSDQNELHGQENSLMTSQDIQESVVKIVPKPDLSNPIAVTDHMEVVVNGKKCLLKMNQDTGQLCAYPILPPEGKRKRGRPKNQTQSKSVSESGSELDTSVSKGLNMEEKPGKIEGQDSDQTNSAAECLLELSNTGPDGVRRSGRVRKKAKTLNDYEMLEVSSDEEQGDGNEDVSLSAASKRKKLSAMRDYTPTTPIGIGPVKRGRGRPRRYPPPGQSVTTTQIPAMIIPSSDGQTLMMAPIQGLANLQAFQEQVKQIPTLLPKPSVPEDQKLEQVTDAASQYLNPPTSVSLPNNMANDEIVVQGILENTSNFELNQTSATIEPRDITPNLTEDSDTLESVKTEETPVKPSSTGSESKIMVSNGENQPTIIQIPENLLPMFMVKKDPVKLGLKASEGELEKLKCPKCNFQAYYVKQYQNHIKTHTDDIHKCKCCNFLSFSKEDLLEHFKENHPRCFCNVCEFMAEHAYVIKRHMMRHNADGCKCEMCGKVYKDQYVLKMHVKMVHMPAEVLFECTLCSKKFTRKAHLKRHLRIHEPEKPFKCPHCTYRGCERSDISKHLLIHEEPKHVCEVCGKAFRHIKNKELHVKRHNGQRDYKCGVCDFYGYTFTDIRKHIERKHTETKPYVCDKCRLPFKTELQLREHQQRECEVVMIEQALAIATSDGGTSQATIQIPSSLSVNGQHIQIDGQQIALDSGGQVITVEQVNLPDEDCITLTEDQLHQAQIAVAQGQVIDTGQVEMISQIHQVGQDIEDSVQHPELATLHMSEEDEEQDPEEMSEAEEVGGVNVDGVVDGGIRLVMSE